MFTQSPNQKTYEYLAREEDGDTAENQIKWT